MQCAVIARNATRAVSLAQQEKRSQLPSPIWTASAIWVMGGYSSSCFKKILPHKAQRRGIRSIYLFDLYIDQTDLHLRIWKLPTDPSPTATQLTRPAPHTHSHTPAPHTRGWDRSRFRAASYKVRGSATYRSPWHTTTAAARRRLLPLRNRHTPPSARCCLLLRWFGAAEASPDRGQRSWLGQSLLGARQAQGNRTHLRS